jgi:hypothetical protein
MSTKPVGEKNVPTPLMLIVMPVPEFSVTFQVSRTF